MKTEDHTLRRNWNRWEACFVARRIYFAIVGIRKFNDFAGERIVEAESSFPVADTLFWKKHPILFWINSPRSTIKNSFKVLSSCISTDIEDCVYFVCEKGRRDGTNRHSRLPAHLPWQFIGIFENICCLPTPANCPETYLIDASKTIDNQIYDITRKIRPWTKLSFAGHCKQIENPTVIRTSQAESAHVTSHTPYRE